MTLLKYGFQVILPPPAVVCVCALMVDSMIRFRDPVRVIQFATRSRSRIVHSFSRVSGSTNSTESD